MTPEEKDKWIALIEGVAAGGQLQYNGGTWLNVNSIAFIAGPAHYRLKPSEPRSIEAWVLKGVFSIDTFGSFWISKEKNTAGDHVRITEILE